MKRMLCASLLILLMPGAQAAPLPGDSAEGKRLLEANCMKCHGTDIFTRKDRKVQSLDALKEQLVACSHAAKKEFTASEMQDLLKYLNDDFYRFALGGD
jgi:cytochrome c553